MTFLQYVDMAVYQPDTASYFKTLKRYGASGSFIQLNYGVGFPNKRAKAQINNSLKYLDFAGCYAFFLGNPVAEAKEFLSYLHYYGMDRTTPVMLDVEPNERYNGPQTDLINKWTDIVYHDGYHNIFIYSMAHWLKDGYHIKPENLKHGRIWAASYGTSEPGVINSSAWQFTDNWKSLRTDGNYFFLPLTVLTGKTNKPKSKPNYPKGHTNTYIKHGNQFMVVATVAEGYKDLNFKHSKGTHLTRGSVIDGKVVSCGKHVTRIATDSGYFSANTKIMKAV